MKPMGRKMGPLATDHSLVLSDARCGACDGSFLAGDYVVLIGLGPGADKEARYLARARRPYNAIALPCHWACVTGEE